MTLENVLSMWRLWQESEALSERTISERAYVIQHLISYTGTRPLELTPTDIVRFTARQDISAASRGTYHASIRAYCAWLVRAELRDDDPSLKTRRPKRPKGQPRPVQNSQLAALLGQVNRRRTRMYILLAALAGLRVHEIAKFRGDDIDLENGIITVNGKGGKTAVIPAHPDIIEAAHQFPKFGPWFPAYTRVGHIQPAAVSYAIMRTMRRAGINGKAHQLRHWYATTLLHDGVDVRIVQTLMRHESLATTAIYTLVDLDQQRAGIARLSLPTAA